MAFLKETYKIILKYGTAEGRNMSQPIETTLYEQALNPVIFQQ